MLNRLRRVYWNVRSAGRERATSLADSRRRRSVFDRAMAPLLKSSPPSMADLEAAFPDLIFGWGNEDWSAQVEFLMSCSQYALKSDGPILECGSGLSTVILGVIAQGTGNTVWSLEHNREWATKVTRVLKRYSIASVHMSVKPLKDYGEYSWYDPPLHSMPSSFSTVVCDGPPGPTKGGRYGLIPIAGSRLKRGTNILLDDAERSSEQDIAARWAAELNTTFEILGSKKPYILLSLPGSPKSCIDGRKE